MSVLVATDFSEASRRALRRAARLAEARESKLVLVHCVEEAVEGPPWGHFLDIPPDMEQKVQSSGRSRLEEFLADALQADPPDRVEYRVELEEASEGIQAAARATGAELIVVGATGRGRVAELLLGSTAEEVVRSSERPVLVVPAEGESGPYRRIVAPVDFSPCSHRSLEEAAALARLQDAALEVVHVHYPPTSDAHVLSSVLTPDRLDALEADRRKRFADFLDGVDLEGIDLARRLQVGIPDEGIVDVVEDVGADLIVMGTHGRRGLERLFLGSTAVKVLRQMPCDVMTLRTLDDDD